MGTTNARNYSPATKAALKEWFIYSPAPVTFSQMADRSEEVVGQKVSREDIVNISASDPEGNWQTLRSIRNPDTIDEKLSNLSNEMYKIAMGDKDETDEKGNKLKTPNSVKVQAARTFNEITSKMSGSGGRSAQTPASRVSELTTEAILEARERKANRKKAR